MNIGIIFVQYIAFVEYINIHEYRICWKCDFQGSQL